MELIDLSRATQTLKDNYVKIESLGGQIEKYQNEWVLAEAELMDAEMAARQIYFASKPCKGYELRDWMKLQTGDYIKRTHIALGKLKLVKDQLKIILECNNNLKMSLKLLEIERQTTPQGQV